MPRRRKPTDQLAIDFSPRQREWPASTRFPYNDPPATVRDVVGRDIRESRSPLIITGYASLIQLGGGGTVRIVRFGGFVHLINTWPPKFE